MPRFVIGCMTGTSVDAIDAAIVKIEGSGLDVRASYVRGITRSLGPLQRPLRAMAQQEPMTAGEIAGLNHEFTLLHADVIADLAGGDRVDLVSVHGQTVFHKPPVSWQLINPVLIAKRTGVMVVSDLRAGDLAAGGQGAPLTPLSDWIMYRDAHERRCVVNLGGFCNLTMLTGDEPGFHGADVCVCNQLLDLIARRVLGLEYDQDGKAASGAEPDHDATDDLLGVFTTQASAGRSLGTGDESAAWIGRHWKGGAGLSGPVLCASACEALAETLAARTRNVDRMILAGGGCRNAALVRAIRSCASCRVDLSAQHGIPIEMREAMGWGVLGTLAVDGIKLPLRHITGAPVNLRAGVIALPD